MQLSSTSFQAYCIASVLTVHNKEAHTRNILTLHTPLNLKHGQIFRILRDLAPNTGKLHLCHGFHKAGRDSIPRHWFSHWGWSFSCWRWDDERTREETTPRRQMMFMGGDMDDYSRYDCDRPRRCCHQTYGCDTTMCYCRRDHESLPFLCSSSKSFLTEIRERVGNFVNKESSHQRLHIFLLQDPDHWWWNMLELLWQQIFNITKMAKSRI